MTMPSFPKSFRPRDPINKPEEIAQQAQTQQQPNFPKSFNPKSQAKPEEFPFEGENDLEREIERNQAMVTSRMHERLFGTPGDIYHAIPETIRKINPLNKLHEKLPTSEKLRSLSEKASLGYTKPKNASEEKAGEFTGDVASFAFGTPAKSILRTSAQLIGIPLAGALAKEGVEKLGGKESTQGFAKLGTMLFLSLWGIRNGVGGGGAKKFGETRLTDAEKAIPKGAVADVHVFENKLNALEKNISKGFTGPHTHEAERIIKEAKGLINHGTMEANLFPRLRKDINKLIENMSGFQIGGPSKKIRKAAVENLNDVKKALIQAGNRWGRGNSPEFFKAWREGNEALSIFHKSNELARFISKNTKVKNPTLKLMLGMHGAQHPAVAGGLAVAKKGAEIATRFPTAMVYRFFKSKVLKDLYTNVIKEAAKGNASSVAAGVKKIEKEMEKENIH